MSFTPVRIVMIVLFISALSRAVLALHEETAPCITAAEATAQWFGALARGDIDDALARTAPVKAELPEEAIRERYRNWAEVAADFGPPQVVAHLQLENAAVVIFREGGPGKEGRIDLDPVFLVWRDGRWLVLFRPSRRQQHTDLSDAEIAAFDKLEHWYDAQKPILQEILALGEDPVDSPVARAKKFRVLLSKNDDDAARAMMAANPRRWWERREGQGEPWGIGPEHRGRWADWDEHFRSRKVIVQWREKQHSATAVIRETNDYFQLLERGWVLNEITYFFDEEELIEGLLIRGIGERPSGRTDEFLAWAREHEPEEIAELMLGGEIDPTGDHPQRFRAILERWRESTTADQSDAGMDDWRQRFDARKAEEQSQ